MPETSEPGPLTVFGQLSGLVRAAVAFVIGLAVGEIIALTVTQLIVIGIIWLSACLILRRNSAVLFRVALYVLIVLLGLGRMQISQAPHGDTLQTLSRQVNDAVQVHGRVVSIPVVHKRLSSVYAPRLYGAPHQTRFLLDVSNVIVDDRPLAANGRCQVYVQSRVDESLSYGDGVVVTGDLAWPKPPGNPGQFDFQQYLKRRDISGQLFVDRRDDVQIVRPVAAWDIRRGLTKLRAETYRVIAANTDASVRGIATAILLGSRYELPADLEQAFVSSGTMHLLAISGLHVSILCLFVLRILNVLLVPRRRALVLTLIVCVVYASLTDLRPSVIRATVFFAVFVCGQLIRRDQRLVNLLAVTVLVMTAWQPKMIFDLGFWLSFLAVAALAWEARMWRAPIADVDAPADALTAGERLRQWGNSVITYLGRRYRQMLCILLFTTPLIASSFHVLSLTGLLMNIVLIPVAAVSLCAGFTMIFAGLLLPAAAHFPGLAFSWLLKLLQRGVTIGSDLIGGHFYLADFAWWVLPSYYGVLIVALMLRRSNWQWRCLTLTPLMLIAGLSGYDRPRPDGVICTVLDVGQGSATVIECESGEVILVDAGARNRADRVAETVCEFLWNCGHTHLNAIVLTHASVDHFSGVPGILSRINVSEVVLAPDFYQADSPAVEALLNLLNERQIPQRDTGDTATIVKCGDLRLRRVISDTRDRGSEQINSDSQRGWYGVVAEYREAGLFLPGNSHLPLPDSHCCDGIKVQVLVSPNHGARNSNVVELADIIQPRHVVVSSQRSNNRDYLETVFAAARDVTFTSDHGAVTAVLAEGASFSLSTHRRRDSNRADRRAAQNADLLPYARR